jgi:hypothetical protein
VQKYDDLSILRGVSAKKIASGGAPATMVPGAGGVEPSMLFENLRPPQKLAKALG